MTARAIAAIAVAAIVVAAVAACGDNRPRDPVIDAVSGDRLAVQWYGYDDGTRTPGRYEMYDKVEHTRCEPTTWGDGVMRCVPIAEEAVYRDAECTDAVGMTVVVKEPSHFLVHDIVDDQYVPTHLYRAGAAIGLVPRMYHWSRGQCVGPFPAQTDVIYHEITGEVDGTTLPELHDDQIGGDRIAVQVRTSDDGMRLPIGLHDRELDRDCHVIHHGDGSVVCEPEVLDFFYAFHDPDCTEPVVVVDDESVPPSIGWALEPSGCATYRPVGSELLGPVYRRSGESCILTTLGFGARALAMGAPIDLPALSSEVETVPERRLQRTVLGDGDLLFYDTQLFDTATGAPCEARLYEDSTTLRCVPVDLLNTTARYNPGCHTQVTTTDVPVHACRSAHFTVSSNGEGMEIRAIGDPANGSVYDFSTGPCAPLVSPNGAVTHLVGPPINPKTFVRALYYGER